MISRPTNLVELASSFAGSKKFHDKITLFNNASDELLALLHQKACLATVLEMVDKCELADNAKLELQKLILKKLLKSVSLTTDVYHIVSMITAIQVSKLDSSRARYLIDMLSSEAYNHVNNGDHFIDLLKCANQETCLLMLKKFQHRLADLIINGDQLTKVLSILKFDHDLQAVVIKQLKSKLPALVKNENQLTEILKLLDKKLAREFVHGLLNQLSSLIKSGDRLIEILARLDDFSITSVMYQLKSNLPELMKSGDQLAAIFLHMQNADVMSQRDYADIAGLIYKFNKHSNVIKNELLIAEIEFVHKQSINSKHDDITNNDFYFSFLRVINNIFRDELETDLKQHAVSGLFSKQRYQHRSHQHGVSMLLDKAISNDKSVDLNVIAHDVKNDFIFELVKRVMARQSLPGNNFNL